MNKSKFKTHMSHYMADLEACKGSNTPYRNCYFFTHCDSKIHLVDALNLIMLLLPLVANTLVSNALLVRAMWL